MKRIVFGISVFGIHLLQTIIEEMVCGTCVYVTDGQSATLLLSWIFMVIVLWNLFMHRAYDAGLKSQFHGAWCLVPFAFFWFLFVPTGYHNKEAVNEH